MLPLAALGACLGRSEARLSRRAVVIGGLLSELLSAGRYSQASIIAHAALDGFSSFPTPSGLLRNDVHVFAAFASDADLGPLKDMANGQRSLLEQLAKDMKRSGFGSSVQGLNGKLWDDFVRAEVTCRTQKSEALPWQFMCT